MPTPEHQAGGNLMTAKDCARGILCFDRSLSLHCAEHLTNDSVFGVSPVVSRGVFANKVWRRGEREEYGHADSSVEDVKGREEEMI
jgi:hypothetical protein